MTRKILTVLSEYGYWGEELVGPVTRFDERGYDITFLTPRGGRPHALPPSLDAGFIDPPLGRSVVSAEVAKLARDLDGSSRLDDPEDLSSWIPERPYTSDAGYLRALGAYNRAVGDDLAERIADYDALLIVGGSGPIVDLVNNGRVHDLILAFLHSGKVIGAECYGVACLAFARDWESRQSIIWNKHVTGHCKEYDYKDGTGFLTTDFNMGPPPYPLEYILRDATGPQGGITVTSARISVVVDHPFVTGRSTPDSFRTGEKIIEVLEHDLRRYGW